MVAEPDGGAMYVERLGRFGNPGMRLVPLAGFAVVPAPVLGAVPATIYRRPGTSRASPPVTARYSTSNPATMSNEELSVFMALCRNPNL
jgi:hypothetical protein